MKKIVQSVLFSALALLIIASCSKDDEPVAAPAKFTIDLTSKDFGSIEVEKTASQTFKITNKGGQNLELKSFTLTGANKAEFNTNAVKTTLKAGKDYSFKVNFAPTAKGGKTATVSIATNVGTKTITLKGNATPKPAGAFSINPTSKDFGNVEVNKTANQVFTIKNTGNADLKITAYSITSTNSSEFLIGDDAPPIPFTIAAGTTKDLTIIFFPKTTGSKTATLKLTTNVGDQTVALTGNATSQPVAAFNINPTSKDFGNIEVNKTANQVFTIKNTGNANLEITGYSIIGTNANQFAVNPAPAVPFTIAANGTKNITIVFSPTAAGSKTATLKLTTNVGDQTVVLTGNATAQPLAAFNINPTSKDFGDVEVNKTANQVFTIKNTGNANLEIRGYSITGTNANQFAVNPAPAAPFTIAANGTKNMTIVFSPTATGSKTATLKLTTNVGEQTVTLTGNATQPAVTCTTPVNIPDAKFKAALLDHGVGITGRGISKIDTNGDGVICTDEANAYTGTINVNRKNITDLTGIEAFTKITKLDIFGNKLTSIDLSKNTDLVGLDASKNKLTNLDISKNSALKYLGCFDNELTSIDISKNIELIDLNCSDNQITILDASKNTKLQKINYQKNQLTSLILKSTALQYIFGDNNKLSSLDLSECPGLKAINCNTNQLTSLDISQNTNLESISCTNNQLTKLNLANGNSRKIRGMNATNNPNLTCIQHDTGFDPTTNTNWKKDSTANWSTNCP